MTVETNLWGQKVVDCYDLLTGEQREQIADIMMEAMSFHDIYPNMYGNET